eukprot:scaffold2103_cov172-Ochromonas_danica.AAC.6
MAEGSAPAGFAAPMRGESLLTAAASSCPPQPNSSYRVLQSCQLVSSCLLIGRQRKDPLPADISTAAGWASSTI